MDNVSHYHTDWRDFLVVQPWRGEHWNFETIVAERCAAIILDTPAAVAWIESTTIPTPPKSHGNAGTPTLEPNYADELS